jgi:hypothetical protein
MCTRCNDDAFAQLRGVAACRGEVWAMDIARRAPQPRPWPAYDGKAASIARAKVTDLAADPALLDRLARELSHWAARWWSRREAIA